MRTRSAAFRILFCSLSCAIGPVASAEEPANRAPPLQSQAAAQAAYYNQKTCERETVVGSHIPKTVCRTQAQRDAERREAQEFQKRQRRPRGTEGNAVLSDS